MPLLLQTIAGTLLNLATDGMTPKTLMAAATDRHPVASKSDIVRAAFYALISAPDVDPARADRLHAMAIASRNCGGAENQLARLYRSKTHPRREDETN